MRLIHKLLFLIIVSACLLGCSKEKDLLTIQLQPESNRLMTEKIQNAIDKCAAEGGGIVHFIKGKYKTGGIHLKSNVSLEFEDGSILEGSEDCKDYGNCKWSDALIAGDDLKNIKIIGAVTLDGVDCKNPDGEEGFRGPHCIRLTGCKNIEIKGITITRSANWAMNFRKCEGGLVENVTVRGGHDAFHTRFCKDFTVNNCDFRTGDDCFAGNDNVDFVVKNCKMNTSCNAFRFGCQNLLVEGCHIWGPGEFRHLVQDRNNTISAFVHFSPTDENPKLKSGNWLIKDVTIEGVDNAFIYNFKDGLWQTGQPATQFVFENLIVSGVKKSFIVIGDSARQFQLTIRNSSLAERAGSYLTEGKIEGKQVEMPAFFNVSNFNTLELDNVSIITEGKTPAFQAQNGEALEFINMELDEGDMMVSNVNSVK